MKILAAVLTLFSSRSPAIAIDPEPATDNVMTLRPVFDPRIEKIKCIAAARLSRKPVPAVLTIGMSEPRREWLLALDTTMLLSLSMASQHQIREHLAGRKAIKGLLAADPASVAAYLGAMKPKTTVYDSNDGCRSGGGPKRSMGELGLKMGR